MWLLNACKNYYDSFAVSLCSFSSTMVSSIENKASADGTFYLFELSTYTIFLGI